MSMPLNIVYLDSEANEYDASIQREFIIRERYTNKSNEELSELAGSNVLDMIIAEYDKCDQPGYTMPSWLTGGIWGFIVGNEGNKEVVRFDWPGCLMIAEEEIKNRPLYPKIIVPDKKNIFVP